MLTETIEAIRYGSKTFLVNDAKEVVVVEGEKTSFVCDLCGRWALEAIARRAIEEQHPD